MLVSLSFYFKLYDILMFHYILMFYYVLMFYYILMIQYKQCETHSMLILTETGKQ